MRSGRAVSLEILSYYMFLGKHSYRSNTDNLDLPYRIVERITELVYVKSIQCLKLLYK